jgi:hypothetical protein
MNQSGGGDVDNGSDISSSGDSDSETESSGVDDVISQRISISQHQGNIEELKANFHSGKLSVDWNGQENFSLC